MRKLSQIVINHKGIVLTIFFVLAAAGALFTTLVSVNYDMVDYLPQDAQSTIAISILDEEFSGDTPNARAMLTNVTIQEALAYKERVSAVDGVTSVSWLDDVLGEDKLATTPLEFLDASIIKNYYKDGHALLSVSIESGKESSAVNAIYDLIGENNAVAGDAANSVAFQAMTVSEVLIAMAFVIPIILIILILSTTSWIEPLLFLLTIGVAVVINMGTTAFFGEISFITQTVTPILQLAVSMDYAIFLLHSFYEYRASCEPKEAMHLAMKRALPTVSASAATTVIGFSALLFMRFGIGSDLGIHLAKGVVLSFLSVMIFLPALTLASYKLLNKTRHKNLVPSFYKVSKGLMKIRIPFLLLTLIVVIPCFLAQSNTSFIYGMGGAAESSRAVKDAALIETTFGRENPLVLLVPKGTSGKEAELCDELSSIPHVTGVVSFVTAVGAEIPPQYVPQEVLDQFYSEHYARIILYTDTPEEGELTFDTVKSVLDTAGRHYGTYYLTGQSATLFDMKSVVEMDTSIVNLVAIAGIFIVILLTFRSLTIPIFLVFTIETAIWINLSFAYFTSNTLSFIGYLIISTVQLGATVDYSILLTNHYLTDRKSLPKKEAMLKTLSDNLTAILISAGILAAAGFTLAATSGNPIVSELGTLLGRGTVLSFVMVVCALPALLIIFDKVIEKTTFKNGVPNHKKDDSINKECLIMKRFLSIFLTVVLMLSAAVPAYAAGTPTQKEEVVYGVLESDGSVQSIYVVNSFKGSMITDYGNYSAVSNMTSSEKLTQSGDMITINTTADRFYYQGTLQTKALPWNVAIRYKLDGKEILASELAGKSGALAIAITITQNKAINPVFYENYMLQISLTLDTERCADIVSPNATLASAGKNKVVAHTVLPGNDANITVTANVQDFTMSGVEITAMPLSMLIEMPDTNSLAEDMTSLSDAVSDLNDGVKELFEGIARTYSGARKLTDGSSDFASGLSELSGNSEEVLGASALINTALGDIVRALDEGSGDLDLGDIAAPPGGLRQLADGLNGISDGMQTLKNGYAPAYSALGSALSSIPDADIDPSGLYAAVYGNHELTATLDQLMGFYAAAKTVKGTYAAVQEAFALVEGSLDAMTGSIGMIAGTLSGMANEIEQSLSGMDFAAQMRQLKDGLSRLSSNYNQFHAGLDKYTSGVEHLSDGYGEIDAGIQSLTGGIGKLNTGTEDLYEGTSELNDAVADLPDTIQIEIDEMVKPYDKSDFVPISFVSNKNTSVTTVQFVLKTPSIELPEMLESAVTTPVKLTFWQKLLKLFGFCSAIETELAELHREIEVVSELTKKPIYENARFVVNQDGFNVQLVKLVNRCTWDMIRDRSGENTNKDTFMHKFLAQWPCSENQATDFFNEFYAAKFPLL